MKGRKAGSPLISVLMPTYNCGPLLAESIDSILAQTLEDFELIIVDDGSTDDSPTLLREYASQDSRIRVVRQENGGVGAALNAGIEMARGKYLARMDADDLTPPQRFGEQVAFLNEHPEITVLGGWHRTFGAESKTYEFPTEPKHLKASLVFRIPISHPTVMMRHQAFEENGWRYSMRRQFPEDYDLWITIAERHELANMPRIYLEYRAWPGSVSHDRSVRWREKFLEIQCRLLARMGLVPDDRQQVIHMALAFDDIPGDAKFIADAHAWLLEICRHNQRQPAVDDGGLTRVLTGRYIALYRAAARCGAQIDGLADSPLRHHVEIPLE